MTGYEVANFWVIACQSVFVLFFHMKASLAKDKTLSSKLFPQKSEDIFSITLESSIAQD